MGSPLRSDRQVFSVPALDGIRAIAITAVFALHLDRHAFRGGGFGVDVFFVLSAYLITTILLREQLERGVVRFGAFYWRRVFRLAPALLLWLVLIALPTALLEHAGSSIVWSSLGSLLYVNDFLEAFTSHIAAAYDQSWSLAVEEQFYLLWPLALVAVSRWRPGARRGFLGVLVAVSIVISFRANYFLPTRHLVALSLGCCAAFWALDGSHGWLRRVCASSFVAIGCLGIFVLAVFVTPGGAWGRELSLVVDVAAMLLVLHCTVVPRSVVSGGLTHPIPRWVGLRSYGIYLYGLTLIQLVPLVTHLPLRFAAPVDVVITAVVAGASYRYVEAPVRSRGRQWLAARVSSPDEGQRDAVPALAAHGR